MRRFIFLSLAISLSFAHLCFAGTMETYYSVEYSGYIKQYAEEMDNATTLSLVLYIDLKPKQREHLLRAIMEATIKAKTPKGNILASVYAPNEEILPLTNNVRFLLYDYKTKKIEPYNP